MAGALGMEAGRIVELEQLAQGRHVQQVYVLMIDSGAPVDVLTAIGWGESLKDEQVLASLRAFNHPGHDVSETSASGGLPSGTEKGSARNPD